MNAKGSIPMSLNRGGSDWIQRDLVMEENILVDDSFKVELARFQWKPASLELLRPGNIYQAIA